MYKAIYRGDYNPSYHQSLPSVGTGLKYISVSVFFKLAISPQKHVPKHTDQTPKLRRLFHWMSTRSAPTTTIVISRVLTPLNWSCPEKKYKKNWWNRPCWQKTSPKSLIKHMCLHVSSKERAAFSSCVGFGGAEVWGKNVQVSKRQIWGSSPLLYKNLSPLRIRLYPLPNGLYKWLIHRGDPNYLLSGVIKVLEVIQYRDLLISYS